MQSHLAMNLEALYSGHLRCSGRERVSRPTIGYGGEMYIYAYMSIPGARLSESAAVVAGLVV